METVIRDVQMSDKKDIVSLVKILGYEIDEKQIETKINKFQILKTEKVLVADIGRVIGWIHASLVEPFESYPFCEIRGVVVFSEYRGKGIGKKLIEEIEKWAKQNKIEKIRVRTNINRIETKQFYKHIDYVSVKTQEVFDKSL